MADSFNYVDKYSSTLIEKIDQGFLGSPFISSAVDFTHEALRLLEAEPETAENADRLKDEKAHASLWLYICTLESNLQEVSALYTTRQRLTFD